MSFEIYMIGLVVAAVVTVAAMYDDWKSRDITRGMAVMAVAIVLCSWFALLLVAAGAVDQSEWGQQTIMKQRKESNDEKSDNQD